jgi:hypothetical protein
MPEDKQLIIHSEVDPGKIISNFSELREEIRKQVEPYVGLDLEAVELKDKKDMLARLRKGRSMIDERRKSVKKEYLVPLNKFEDLCKELNGEFDRAITEIDTSVKSQIKKERDEKWLELWKYMETKVDDQLYEFIGSTNFFFDEKWLNSSVSMKKAQTEIDEKIEKVKKDLQVLSGEAYYDRLIEQYGKSGDISSCLSMRDRLAEQDEQARKLKESMEAQKAEKKTDETIVPGVKDSDLYADVGMNSPTFATLDPSNHKITTEPAEESTETKPTTIKVKFEAEGSSVAMMALGDFCRENRIKLRRI